MFLSTNVCSDGRTSPRRLDVVPFLRAPGVDLRKELEVLLREAARCVALLGPVVQRGVVLVCVDLHYDAVPVPVVNQLLGPLPLLLNQSGVIHFLLQYVLLLARGQPLLPLVHLGHVFLLELPLLNLKHLFVRLHLLEALDDLL